ncbi:acyltransferase family protein [Rhizobium leguminosarum]|uniref:acyltransferase family protein n=1 Tax=Rhizobium leguminosarum TaxID=384 RepID=UPI0013EE8745|nr:acyltransferase [Rhizobium leguminosarum]
MKTDARVTTVDFARGLMASAVMTYHLLYWEGIADVERIGFYAVYGFFVISGFSLQVAYRDKLGNADQLRRFAIRRYARIAPLFYTAIVLYLLQNQMPDRWPILFLANFSLALGFMHPGDTSMLVGGWSIGVEMVFYVLFPWIVMLAALSVRRLAVMAVAALLVQMIFVNDALAGLGSMAEGWVRYTEPIAFIGYFVVGMLFAELYKARPYLKGAPIAPAIALLCLVPFILLPGSASIDLLRGWQGFTLAMATIILVGAAAFVREPSGRLLQLSEWIGKLSYPIYLLHPIVFVFVRDHGTPTSTLRIVLTLTGTFSAAYLVNRFVEEPCRNYGRRLTAG